MPRVNIYIRNEDVENWEAIENKPEWLHLNLNKGYKVITNNADGSGKVENVKKNVIKKVDDIKIPDHVYRAFDKACKNGHILNKFGKCMEKGCKYAIG